MLHDYQKYIFQHLLIQWSSWQYFYYKKNTCLVFGIMWKKTQDNTTNYSLIQETM